MADEIPFGIEDDDGNPIVGPNIPKNTLDIHELPSEAIPDRAAQNPPFPMLRHRLRNHVAEWRQLGMITSLVLSIVLHGLQINWNDDPTKKIVGPATRCDLPNHPSTDEHLEFVDSTMLTALQQGAVRRLPPELQGSLICIMPLGVARHPRTGKLRLIYDARHLNQFVKYEKFKMDQLSGAGRTVFADARFAYTIDITSAYCEIFMPLTSSSFFFFF